MNSSLPDRFEDTALGKQTDYASTYTPSLLQSIQRKNTRGQSLEQANQQLGEDLWTGYEFSWLDAQGKPRVGGVRVRVACQSKAIVESKSMKLYLNSFAQTKFETQADVLNTLDKDLSLAFQSPILVELIDINQLVQPVQQLSGRCLDDLDIFAKHYERNPELLVLESSEVVVHESFFTNIFRSLCPVTGQPDWASISIEYAGQAINQEGLLKYLISYRNHPAFHETTIEQIFVDIMSQCKPTQLSVYGRFQRRGGLDINPFRSTHEHNGPLCRLPRQ